MICNLVHINRTKAHSFFHHDKRLLVIYYIIMDSDNDFRMLTFSSDHNHHCRIFPGYYLEVILYYHVFAYYLKFKHIASLEYVIQSLNFPMLYLTHLSMIYCI